MANALTTGKPTTFRQHLIIALLLWVMVLVSALSVIYSSHDTRILFNELELLRQQQDDLQVQWGKYLLEESAWASYGRIENVAIEQLSMHIPNAGDIVVVTHE